MLATLIPREKEVQDKKGNWHHVRLMPYRTGENVIDGLVMTIVDINRVKKAEISANTATAYFENIVQTVREPLIVLDGGLRVISANDSFYNTFGTVPKQTEEQLIYEVGNRQWDIPELRRLLEEVLPQNSVMTDFRVEHDFPKIGRRTFMLNARRVQNEGDKGLILLAFEEVNS